MTTRIKAATLGLLLFMPFALDCSFSPLGWYSGDAGSSATNVVGGDGAVVPSPGGGPSKTAPAAGDAFIAVSAGSEFGCAVKTSGALACWGMNDFGQSKPPAGTFTSVGCSWLLACGLRTNGSIVCWGDNTLDRATPPAGTFSAIAVAPYYACGVKKGDGTVVCWGSWPPLSAPLQNAAFKSISASVTSGGYDFMCGVRTDNTLACWTVTYPLGQATPPAGTFTSVSATDGGGCAIRSDGTIACWGVDFKGASPPEGAFLSVGTSDGWACAVSKTDGGVVCWNFKSVGSSTPSVPAGAFSAVSVNHGNACALGTDGTIACWDMPIP